MFNTAHTYESDLCAIKIRYKNTLYADTTNISDLDRFVLVDQHKKAASGWGSALNSWALPGQQPGYIWQYTGLIDSSSTAISEPTTIQAENRKPGLWPDPPGLAARRAEPTFDSKLGSSIVLI